MTVTADAPAAAPASESTAPRPAPSGLAGVLGSGDHKVVGRLWLVAGLAHLLLVGVISVLLSAERIDPATLSIFGSDTLVQADTFRFIAGVFLAVVPLTIALATTIVPLQVGAPTIAFPRAAAAAAWAYLVGGGLILGAYAIDGGPGGTDRDGVVLFVVAFALVLVALTVAWICVATTVLALRAPGMRLARVPLFAWSGLVAGTVWILTLPVLAGLAVLSYLDARYGGFIGGGEGALFARISWAFSTPTIYVLAVPVVGFVGSVVPVAAQTRHHLHRVALGLIGAIGVLSVGVWTMPNLGGSLPWLYEGPWIAVSTAALVPLLGLVGLWGATVRAGRVVLSSPLLFAVVAALLALLGVAAGAAQAIKPIKTLVDGESTPLFGTSWSTGVTALLLLAGAAAALGGIVYWAPKLLGARLHEGGARLVAVLVLVGSAVGCIAQLAAGLLGEPSPAVLGATDNLDAIKSLDTVVTAGDGILGLAGLLFVLLVLRAAFRGEDPGDDPWSGHTLEWATSSPPPVGNFTTVPAITSEAPLYDARHAQGADA
jgi:heme/copper-type cytochrome/quinol oxidase subunit 1